MTRKQSMVVLVVVVLLVVVVTAVHTAKTRAARKPVVQIGVAELAAHPLDHLGDVLVAGTVGKVDASQSLVLLSDGAACSSCDSGCDDEGARVPVRWSGKLPKVGDQLVVKGRLAKQAEGLVLTGSSVGPPSGPRANATKRARQ